MVTILHNLLVSQYSKRNFIKTYPDYENLSKKWLDIYNKLFPYVNIFDSYSRIHKSKKYNSIEERLKDMTIGVINEMQIILATNTNIEDDKNDDNVIDHNIRTHLINIEFFKWFYNASNTCIENYNSQSNDLYQILSKLDYIQSDFKICIYDKQLKTKKSIKNTSTYDINCCETGEQILGFLEILESFDNLLINEIIPAIKEFNRVSCKYHLYVSDLIRAIDKNWLDNFKTADKTSFIPFKNFDQDILSKFCFFPFPTKSNLSRFIAFDITSLTEKNMPDKYISLFLKLSRNEPIDEKQGRLLKSFLTGLEKSQREEKDKNQLSFVKRLIGIWIWDHVEGLFKSKNRTVKDLIIDEIKVLWPYADIDGIKCDPSNNTYYKQIHSYWLNAKKCIETIKITPI